ncbi:MAG: hypothetical protein A2284_10715 [Deltaproteobacteria bacterium RIFOXYA12_FULL_61_11]|nr:MAG: hypothetical protein A2284_10715 [Deltaproteobacteria bacterium RIFOXYA12_FULL_61_11]
MKQFRFLVPSVLLVGLACSDTVVDMSTYEMTPQETKEFLSESTTFEQVPGTQGKALRTLGVRVDQSFLRRALDEQTLIDLGELSFPEPISVQDPGVPCIKSFTISALHVVGLQPSYVRLDLDGAQNLLITGVRVPSGTPIHVRGLISWENSCSLNDLGQLAGGGDLGPLGGLVDTAIGMAGVSPKLQVPGGGGDLFEDLFGVDLQDTPQDDFGIFGQDGEAQVDSLFDVDDQDLEQLGTTLASMSTEEFLGQDLFQDDMVFEVDLLDLDVTLPLRPSVIPDPGFSRLDLTVVEEGLALSFTPRITRLGTLPPEVVDELLASAFPEGLASAMTQNVRGPASSTITAYLRATLADQIELLQGDFDATHFDPLFERLDEVTPALLEGQPFDRAGVHYLFDFHRAQVVGTALEVDLNGLISSTAPAHACLGDFAASFAPASAAPAATATWPGYVGGQLELLLASPLVNQALYAFAKNGFLCRTIPLTEETVVTLSEQLMERLVEDLPKVGPAFPPEVRQKTLRAFLEDLGVLDMVRNQQIGIAVLPTRAPVVEFVEGGLQLQQFWFEVSVRFGEVEMLVLRPRFEATAVLSVSGGRLLLLEVRDIVVGGEVVGFASYGQLQGAPLDTLARTLVGEEYGTLLNQFVNGLIQEHFAGGLAIADLEVAGLALGLENATFVPGFLRAGMVVR